MADERKSVMGYFYEEMDKATQIHRISRNAYH
jgi:hypothetical protein